MPMVEICFWPETVARWHREGLPADQHPNAFFDLDVIAMVAPDCTLGLEPITLEETPEYKVARDRDGSVHKAWKASYATPAAIDHLIKNRDDWVAHRHRLRPGPERLAPSLAESVGAAHSRGQFVAMTPTEPAWWVLRTLGMEEALPLIAAEPDWFAEMVAAHASMTLELCQRLAARPDRPDALWFFADLCYRNGMLFSPRAYRELVLPWHRRFAELCHEHDMSFILHCDGDVREFIPLLIEAGVDCVQPLEARAGNDVRELKPRYGQQIAFFGNLDMDVFAAGDPCAVNDEVTSKLAAAMPGGGYVYHSDHSVPPTVSFATYAQAVATAKACGRYG